MSGRLKVPAALSARQMEVLRASSPTPNDILENPDFAKELSDEIVSNFDQDAAVEEALKDQTLEGLNPLAPETNLSVPEVPVAEPVEDPMKALEAIERQADAKLQQQRDKAEAEAASTDAEPDQELSMDQVRRKQILELLSRSKNAPTEATVANWKRQHGANGVNVIALGEGDTYVFTHLRRGQWKKIQEVVGKAAAAEVGNQSPEDMMREKVLQFCILYPTPLTVEFFYNSRAGVIDTLYEMILVHSYFLQPQQSMMLTTQL